VTGTLINTATVVLGTLAGRLVGGRLPVRIQETQMAAIGLVTLALGAHNALSVFAPGHPSNEFLAALLALLVGGWVGEALGLDERINALGRVAEARFTKQGGSGEGDFARAFVTTSILFCVGPLTVLGCFDDGLNGDIRKLVVKSVLDGVSSAAFAAALGWGVLLSAGTVFFVQGALTLAAGLLRPVLSDAMVSAMTGAGGVLLLGLGLNLLGVTKIRTASLLPALVLAPLFWRLLHASA
jgi:uncharacterized membrane protein YqgA involved in biofilm formation